MCSAKNEGMNIFEVYTIYMLLLLIFTYIYIYTYIYILCAFFGTCHISHFKTLCIVCILLMLNTLDVISYAKNVDNMLPCFSLFKSYS